MNIFQSLNIILYKKRRVDNLTVEDLQDYNNYMMNRWLSMHSPEVAILVNITTNRFWSILREKDEHFKFLQAVIPQMPFRRMSYIKKSKKSDKEKIDKETVKKIASRFEISSREVEDYIKKLDIDITKFKKDYL